MTDDQIAAIAERLRVVKQALADNEVDVLNPAHHASWTDIEDLLAAVAAATQEIERLKAESVQAMARHYGCGEHVSFTDAWRWLAERVEMTRLAQSELETHKSNADTAMDALADRIAQLRKVRERAESAERQRDALREALRSVKSQCAGHSDEFSGRVWRIADAVLAATEGQ